MKLILTAITLIASLITPVFAADSIRGRVVNVADGDTITVLDQNNVQHKVRLDGIDAPEKTQPFGNTAKDRLSALLSSGREHGFGVYVISKGKDLYGRTVGQVFAVVDINELLVREGLAFHYLQYAPNNKALADAESFARKYRLGVWSLANGGVRPWDFRRGKKIDTPTNGGGGYTQTTPDRARLAETENKDVAKKQTYWVTKSSGKIHNISCRYYANSKGYSTDDPHGTNCSLCGGKRRDANDR